MFTARWIVNAAAVGAVGSFFMYRKWLTPYLSDSKIIELYKCKLTVGDLNATIIYTNGDYNTIKLTPDNLAKADNNKYRVSSVIIKAPDGDVTDITYMTMNKAKVVYYAGGKIDNYMYVNLDNYLDNFNDNQVYIAHNKEGQDVVLPSGCVYAWQRCVAPGSIDAIARFEIPSYAKRRTKYDSFTGTTHTYVNNAYVDSITDANNNRYNEATTYMTHVYDGKVEWTTIKVGDILTADNIPVQTRLDNLNSRFVIVPNEETAPMSPENDYCKLYNTYIDILKRREKDK